MWIVDCEQKEKGEQKTERNEMRKTRKIEEPTIIWTNARNEIEKNRNETKKKPAIPIKHNIKLTAYTKIQYNI